MRVPYRIFAEGIVIEPEAIKQMEDACSLDVSVRGAMCPDAHSGFGLPIGGVLATRNAIIPYAVGCDIACRMSLTVFDYPVKAIKGEVKRLIKIIEDNTVFGVGAATGTQYDHAVMEEDWSFSEITEKLKANAWSQLGTSGSGNHFCEFGTLTLEQDELGLKAGVYFALLTHGGSRNTGLKIAEHYTKMAQRNHQNDLPKYLLNLAWLDMDHEAGQEYWAAMNLMGRYAAANHEIIHDRIRRALKTKVLLHVENHHNFAWKETLDGEEVIVHRKGATPAHLGTLGVVPGSMATPGYIVRGKGNAESINSCSHGAGRAMSRKKTKEGTTWNAAKKFLAEKEVVLISAGLDEVPFGYKDIEKVMAAQKELVDIVARFDPRIVKMAGLKGDDGE